MGCNRPLIIPLGYDGAYRFVFSHLSIGWALFSASLLSAFESHSGFKHLRHYGVMAEDITRAQITE
jgi:hypothetical protein